MPTSQAIDAALCHEFRFVVKCGQGQHEVSAEMTAWGRTRVVFNPCAILPSVARRFSASSCEQTLAATLEAVHRCWQVMWFQGQPEAELPLPAESQRALILFLDQAGRSKERLAAGLARAAACHTDADLGGLLRSTDPALQWAAIVLAGTAKHRRLAASLIDQFDELPFDLQLSTACTLMQLQERAGLPLLASLATDERVIAPLRAELVKRVGQFGDERAVGPLVAALLAKELVVADMAEDALAKLLLRLRQTGAARVRRALTTALDQSSRFLRETVVALLSLIGRPLVPDLITVFCGSSSTVRSAAAQILGQLGDARAAEQLVYGLDDPDPEVAYDSANAVLALLPALRAAGVRVVPLLVRAMRAKNMPVAVAATRELGALASDDAVEPLIRVLESESPAPRRAAAAKALGQIADLRGVPALIGALSGGDSADVPAAAAEALGRTRDLRAASPLLRALTEHEDPEVLSAAARALLHVLEGQRGASAELELLRQTARAPHVLVVAATVRRLATLGNAEAVPLLVDALATREPEIRFEVVEALRVIGDLRALEPLLCLLPACQAALRECVAEAIRSLLRRLPGQLSSHWDALQRALSAPHAGVAVEAARTLSGVHDPRSSEALLRACLRGIPRLSVAAGQALGRGGRSQDLLRLTRLLRDGDDRMATGAELALAAAGEPAVAPLIKAAKWDFARARAAAARALGQIGDPRALPVLRSACHDRIAAVREAASCSVRQLEAKEELRCPR